MASTIVYTNRWFTLIHWSWSAPEISNEFSCSFSSIWTPGYFSLISGNFLAIASNSDASFMNSGRFSYGMTFSVSRFIVCLFSDFETDVLRNYKIKSLPQNERIENAWIYDSCTFKILKLLLVYFRVYIVWSIFFLWLLIQWQQCPSQWPTWQTV